MSEKDYPVVLSLEKKNFFPGEMLKGTVKWHFDGDCPDDNFFILLKWETSGVGDQDMEVVDSFTFPASPSGEKQFSFSLPYSPYSLTGQLITIK